ncbi:serine hydrolase domain-containing protein [Kibdelosporangium phytohabitans]|uniref:Serine hydrolase n=1 Tax=Kibdelosporangium phytohabitans TaxID=860235 RepID=A0A0N7F5G9_9PSEU|nr:serine hydrolase domain-containing protein [Kibdelosporangium phytohabitans]ALG14199.1 serine hydrolase [Kibdelosporangium phytohabitans]MBE1466806.1 D-alanyl-D-alanine carboxypeptidase [Kibdelosporangium phytohabitans]
MKYSLLTAVVAAALTAGAVTASAHPEAAGPRPELDNLVQREGYPAALLTVEIHGRPVTYTAGVSQIGRPLPPPRNGRVRAGSNTKAFVAVVVMQLVAEGKVELDAPIERYLPGIVRGEGIDGNAIKIRHLLQHTSGLPNYTKYLGLEDIEKARDTYFDPRRLVDVALQQPASFKPGTDWEYSNTGYALLGLTVERVTGRPIAEQVTTRIVERIGLRDTYWPNVGERTIRGPHPHGYARTKDGRIIDITVMDPSWGWAAGQLVTTPADLNGFYGALVSGNLVPAAQLAEMKKTVPAKLWAGARYGLGIMSSPLTCGGVYWGHGGDIHGYETRGGATEDGRKASIGVTAMSGLKNPAEGERNNAAVLSVVDKMLCT